MEEGTIRAADVRLRSATADDAEFLFGVYAATRSEEMALTGWSPQEIGAFLRMQFGLQHTQYRKNYRYASFDLVLIKGKPAGRLYVDRRNDDIRVIDIALLPEFRRRGIGSALMAGLIREADRKKLPLSLHVEHDNPVHSFYERLGFRKIDTYGVYSFMRRPPSMTRAENHTEKEGQMIERLTIDSFHPHAGEKFKIKTASGEEADLELVEMADTSTDMVEGFHLIFRGPAGRVFSHDTHKIIHPKIGEFDLFLGPIIYGKTDGVYYQAVFSRLRPNAKALMKTAGKAVKAGSKKPAKKAVGKKAAKTVKKTVKTVVKKTVKKTAKKRR